MWKSNKMCKERAVSFTITIYFICLLQLSHAAFLRCYYNGSIEQYVKTPLEKPQGISPCIRTSIPTTIYTFGYKGKTDGPATTAMLEAYIARNKSNVILLDWENEAQSGILGIAITYAINALPNAKKIGRQLGDALSEFSKIGVNMDDVHLIGHSLGAQLMGYAGRKARTDGNVVGRITGLDPARALFEGTLAINAGLDRTCAKFVDIIHTDPNGYGTSMSSGSVDIWPNYAGGHTIQPGCPKGEFEMFTTEDLCSHDRSWKYYAESLGAPTSFPAAAASDLQDWLNSDGNTTQTIYLGELTNTKARGNFYLRTNWHTPFGLGAVGIIPARRTQHEDR